jgi:hypothetical protein
MRRIILTKYQRKCYFLSGQHARRLGRQDGLIDHGEGFPGTRCRHRGPMLRRAGGASIGWALIAGAENDTSSGRMVTVETIGYNGARYP